ncbi:hypothetical protein [Amnibacterium setariae]|uniref:MmcQ/YjbR family DNA-binding protein n=1 Tax=Amnibacterium setariae TaxID=2306585 RepID=A0A3A1U0H2_9MICO|nr:hypothetical protein [Amnibacterium setariae]RIX28425.1 hypothetical protein D1781_13410 [Amnibacterium setariae]
MSAFGTPEFDAVKGELLADVDDDVTDGPDGLLVKGALFAYESEGSLVVDLPEQRATDLVERGVAQAVEAPKPAKGRWVSVQDTDDWLELATEAHQFVGEPAVGRDS